MVLTLPIAGILKSHFPNCRIYFLGQAYTKEVVESCKHVDVFIDWLEVKDLNESEQIDFFKQLNFDIALHVFPNIHISWLLKKAGVPLRIGTSHRWFHWFYCNKLVSFSRRRSNLHEAQLNLFLLKPLGIERILTLSEIFPFYGIQPLGLNPSLASQLSAEKFNLILHPKSRGNGREWGVDNFSILISLLDPEEFKIFVTGTLTERKLIQKEIFDRHPEVTDLTGKLTLNELLGFIARADGLLASGTGPLHLAAALGIHAVGLFPPIRPVHPGRWAPVGINAHVFMAEKKCIKCHNQTGCECMHSIDPKSVADKLRSLSKINSNAI